MDNTGTLKCPSCGGETGTGEKFCRKCGTSLAVSPDRAVPRPATEDKKKTSSFQIVLLAVTALLAVFLIATFLDNLPGGDHPVIAEQPVVPGPAGSGPGRVVGVPVNAEVVDGKIVIPVELLKQNRMIEFEYRDATTTVPLLAYISGEGKLVTSIRMCEPCNARHFSIEGDDLACGNCETRWVLNTLEGIQGSCQKYPPDPFPSTIENGSIVIDLSHVINWKIRI